MSVLEGKMVRANCGTVGRVLAVALKQDDEVAYAHFVALVKCEDGRLQRVALERAELIDEPYTKPPPTSMPGPGEGYR